ncbi:riboflavin kinase [Cylindrobasidium torrendii FP15055 ss-10]|uniref:Riboflavin kinase n=1 Tax=Cylindrobasidium torrendii FP15055 ss-10 TaxID=1314674 RepID=A0A0D7AYP3_9AGAR|nr:riboflavin kinase [Cylindrobasidium torrendii FP15055 ss-10]
MPIGKHNLNWRIPSSMQSKLCTVIALAPTPEFCPLKLVQTSFLIGIPFFLISIVGVKPKLGLTRKFGCIINHTRTTTDVFESKSTRGSGRPMRPSSEPRVPTTVGSSSGPEPPFPLRMEGKVIHGYGRGSKELGIPTANLPVDSSLTPWITDITSGVYFGWTSLRLPSSTLSNDTTSTSHSGFSLYPMVMSIMSNKFYHNTERSAEVHVLHEFEGDFYGAEMRVLLTGFIRGERGDYANQEELIEDIKLDCEVARKSLDREAWALREMGRGTLDGSWLVRA